MFPSPLMGEGEGGGERKSLFPPPLYPLPPGEGEYFLSNPDDQNLTWQQDGFGRYRLGFGDHTVFSDLSNSLPSFIAGLRSERFKNRILLLFSDGAPSLSRNDLLLELRFSDYPGTPVAHH
jgi:hypothetical protein